MTVATIPRYIKKDILSDKHPGILFVRILRSWHENSCQ